MTFARAVIVSFGGDECLFLAGGVAYQLFFALIPLLALVVGVLGFVYGTDRAQSELVQLFRQIYPSATQQEVRIARELVDGRALSLGIGVVGTILAISAVHSSVDLALAAVLRGGRKRSFARGYVDALAFVGGIALLAVLSFALSYGAQAAQGALASAGLGQTARTVIGIGSPLLGLAAGYVFFALIYRYVPRTAVGLRTARLAALVSAVLWEIAKVAFGFFTRALGTFNAYGPLAFAFGLLAWVYLTAVIILVGAEVIKVRTRA
jgi:membrane protein